MEAFASTSAPSGNQVIICLGCGEAVRQSSERRNLATAASSHVIPQWKAVLQSELERRGTATHLAMVVQDVIERKRAGFMCRRCFYAYDKFSKAKATLEANASKAVDALTAGIVSPSSYSTPKRSSSNTAVCPAAKRRPQHTEPSLPSVSCSKGSSPQVSVHVGYNEPRTYALTPSRKYIGKAIARGRRQTVAIECLREKRTRVYLLKRIGMALRNELRVMCSESTNSILSNQSVSELKDFTWNKLLSELEKYAPTFLMILRESTHTRQPRHNRNAVIGMCAALILKLRFSKMCLVQKIMSLILYGGHSGKQVYERLQKVHVTTSHAVVVRLLMKLGEGHDEQVKMWQESLTTALSLEQGHTETCNSFPVHAALCPDDQSSELSSSSEEDSDSIAAPQYSPIVSEQSLSDLSSSECETELADHATDEPVTQEAVTPQLPEVHNATNATSAHLQLQSYKLVGDNIDKSVRARYLRYDGGYGNRSLHYFHYYAVLNRIDFSGLPDVHPHTCQNSPQQIAVSLLPSADDDAILRHLFVTHVSRILCTHIPFFKSTFGDIVEWHIEHRYYSAMSTKSHVVPLGILSKNENKRDDMVEIMSHLHQYVPTVTYLENFSIQGMGVSVQVPRAMFHKILFGGDQLTAARARGAQRIRMNSTSPQEKLEGLIPCSEDWHTKLNLLGVIWKYFFSTKSAAEHGTLYQLRNLIHRTNVVSDPAKDFNACDDFIVLVVTCHVLAASLEVLGMKSLSDSPVLSLLPPELENEPQNLWMLMDSERKRVLDHITGAIVDRFINFQFHADTQRYEDSVQDYAIQLLSLGCFYLEYADAIREGDGDRVLRCWRYLLPIFKSSGRTNYSIEALSFLHQYQYLLTPRQSAELLWNRFVNVHGVRGKNISCDLHLEHLNRVCKNAISDLGVNKTEKAIKRVGNVLGTLYPVLQQFDSDNHIRDTSGTHRMPTSERDRDRIIHELQQSNVFSSIPSRTHHQSFPKPRHVLHDSDHEKLHQWIIEHI